MTCTPINLPGGGFAIACSRTPKKRCKWCSATAEKLCDYKVTTRKSGTCDADMCAKCAVNVGHDRDFCPPHARHDKAKAGAS